MNSCENPRKSKTRVGNEFFIQEGLKKSNEKKSVAIPAKLVAT